MQNHFPQKRTDDLYPIGPDFEGIHEMFERIFAQTQAQMQQLMSQISSQVQFEDRHDAYVCTVFLEGIEQPKDIEARFDNGYLHLRRTVQMQTQRDGDHGGVWQSYYQHFERSIELPGHIDWNSRRITSRPGSWTIYLPKRQI